MKLELSTNQLIIIYRSKSHVFHEFQFHHRFSNVAILKTGAPGPQGPVSGQRWMASQGFPAIDENQRSPGPWGGRSLGNSTIFEGKISMAKSRAKSVAKWISMHVNECKSMSLFLSGKSPCSMCSMGKNQIWWPCLNPQKCVSFRRSVILEIVSSWKRSKK